MQANKISIAVVILMSLGHFAIGLMYYDQKPGTGFAYGAGGIIAASIITAVVTAITYFVSGKSSKAANIALIATFVGVSLAGFNQARISSPKALQTAIHRIVEQTNMSLPKQVDEITVFQRVAYDDTAGEIRFLYEVTATDFEITDEVRTVITKGAIDAYRGKIPEKMQRLFKAAEARVLYVYSRAGSELMRVQVN